MHFYNFFLFYFTLFAFFTSYFQLQSIDSQVNNFYLFQEHHLQRAICTGLIIPTPEVLETDRIFYEKCYPADFKPTRQMIHMQRKCFYLFGV